MVIVWVSMRTLNILPQVYRAFVENLNKYALMNLSNSSSGLSVQSDRKCFFSSVMTSIWAPGTPRTHSRRPASCPPPPCSHTAPRGTTKSPDSLIIINKKLFNEPEYCEKLDSHFSWRRPPSNLFSLASFPLTNRIYSLSCYKTL